MQKKCVLEYLKGGEGPVICEDSTVNVLATYSVFYVNLFISCFQFTVVDIIK
jgi:hypothetical protein